MSFISNLSYKYFQLWLSISTLSTFSFSSSDWSVLQRAAKSTLLSMSILSQPSCLLRIFWPTLFNVQLKRVQDRIVYILRYFFYPFPHLWCCFEYASVGIRRAIYDLSLYEEVMLSSPIFQLIFCKKISDQCNVFKTKGIQSVLNSILLSKDGYSYILCL